MCPWAPFSENFYSWGLGALIAEKDCTWVSSAEDCAKHSKKNEIIKGWKIHSPQRHWLPQCVANAVAACCTGINLSFWRASQSRVPAWCSSPHLDQKEEEKFTLSLPSFMHLQNSCEISSDLCHLHPAFWLGTISASRKHGWSSVLVRSDYTYTEELSCKDV